MPKFTIEASDGEVLAGYLPKDWGEVPLSPYTAFLLTARPVPDSITPTVHPFAHPAGCEALATLLQLPTAAPFLADLSLLLDIYQAVPWLFVGPFPASADPAPALTHLGTTYAHVGELDQTNGGELEALLTFLQASEGNPLTCAPHLLSVLYCPAGQLKTPASVKAASEAFHSLPMSYAWPAIQAFLVRSAPLVLAFQKYGAAQLAAEQALNALEQLTASPTLGPLGFCSNMRRWLARHWIKLVRNQLRISSLRFAFTAAPTR